METTPHISITLDRVIAAVEESTFGLANAGFCLSCGEDADGCEPDAERYLCDACGERQVYGASEVLLLGAYSQPGAKAG